MCEILQNYPNRQYIVTSSTYLNLLAILSWKHPTNRKNRLELTGDIIGALVFQPLTTDRSFNDEIVGNIPSHPRTNVPGKVCFVIIIVPIVVTVILIYLL